MLDEYAGMMDRYVGRSGRHLGHTIGIQYITDRKEGKLLFIALNIFFKVL